MLKVVHDVTLLSRDQGFCDGKNIILAAKQMRDVIYGRPLNQNV
jgi:hypothetical protein